MENVEFSEKNLMKGCLAIIDSDKINICEKSFAMDTVNGFMDKTGIKSERELRQKYE